MLSCGMVCRVFSTTTNKKDSVVAFCTLFFHALSNFEKNKIDRKMQREKLYNLRMTALLIIADFVSEIDTILSYHTWTVRTQYFFVGDFSSSHHFGS